mgnify:CR=1 FL=1
MRNPPHIWRWGSKAHLSGQVRFVAMCARCGRSVGAPEFNRDRLTWLRQCPELDADEAAWLRSIEAFQRKVENRNEVQGSLFG